MKFFNIGRKEKEASPTILSLEIAPFDFEKRMPESAQRILLGLINNLTEKKSDFGWGIVGFQNAAGNTFLRLTTTSNILENLTQAQLERNILIEDVKQVISDGQYSSNETSCPEDLIRSSPRCFYEGDRFFSLPDVEIIVGNPYHLNFDSIIANLRQENISFSQLNVNYRA